MPAIANEIWSPGSYCLSSRLNTPDDELSVKVYERVCRTDFSAPGFCLINLGPDVESLSLRSFMVALNQGLREIHRSRASRDLVYLSAARFDQQVTTKLHRDGGPDECFLMLGYEPSQVPSEVVLADYSKCAFDMGLSPDELLTRHNPMFGPGEELLRKYSTRVACFSNQNSQILLINNSIAKYSVDGERWQGVLHAATVQNPSDDLRRIVNSTMVASVPIGTPEPISEVEQNEFVTTTLVRRRGYDKKHLSDDT